MSKTCKNFGAVLVALGQGRQVIDTCGILKIGLKFNGRLRCL